MSKLQFLNGIFSVSGLGKMVLFVLQMCLEWNYANFYNYYVTLLLR